MVVNTVRGSNRDKLTVGETRIDYSKRWQHQHRMTLVSAYRAAPYFDHYWPRLEGFYSRRFGFLADLNTELLATLMSLLGCDRELRFSERYIEPGQEGINDLRDALSPKPRLARADPAFSPARYWQVFSDRMPFAANLSVVDLLFCEGPRALQIIRDSVVFQP